MKAPSATPATSPTAARPVNTCRKCGAEGYGMVLHHDPDVTGPVRTVCGTCQGKAGRRIVDNLNSSGRSK